MRLLRPGWVVLHLLAVSALVVMVWAGGWQWSRVGDGGGPQNVAYAAQWLLFAAFLVVAYGKILRDEVRGAPEAPGPAEDDGLDPAVAALLRSPRPAPAAPAEDDDPELAAYNAHLRWLADNPRD